MMGLSLPPAASIDDALKLIAAVSNPTEAKKNLEQLAAEVVRLNKLQAETAEMQRKAQADRADADAAMARLSARVEALNLREEFDRRKGAELRGYPRRNEAQAGIRAAARGVKIGLPISLAVIGNAPARRFLPGWRWVGVISSK